MNNNEYYDIHKTNSPPSQPSSKQKDLSLDQARQWLLLSRRKSQEMEFFINIEVKLVASIHSTSIRRTTL